MRGPDDFPHHNDALARAAQLPFVRHLTDLRITQQLGQTWRRSRLVSQPTRFAAAELLGRPGRVGAYSLRDSGVSIVVRHRTRDIDVFHEIFINDRPYDLPEEIAIPLRRLGRPPRVLDLGANVGLFVAQFQQRFPGATVICVEPDPHNLPLLHRCLSLNELTQVCPVIEACASNRNGVVSFISGQHADSRIGSSGTAPTVKAKSIDVFDLIDGIDLVKIDIEGSEWEILHDPRLADAAVSGIVLEWHGDAYIGEDAEAIALRSLERKGFRVLSRRAGGSLGTLWAVRESKL
jgi:FkbM family methyltransferase